MVVSPWVNSIVRLVSTDRENNRFGTGFVIYSDDDSTYILTCAHVLRAVGGPNKIVADGRRAWVIASGEEVDVDLAIIKINARLNRSPLVLQSAGAKGMAIKTAGFDNVLGQNYIIRELNGVLGQQIGLEFRSRTTRLDAWDIQITDQFTLQPGQSGSPIIDDQSGSVIAIVSMKHGEGERGLAISARVVHDLWPDLPALFLNEDHQERQYVDWGHAPDVSSLFGRTGELTTLRQWITEDHCRIVSIVGLRGVGKTAITIGLSKGRVEKTDLPVSLVRGLQDDFEFIIWRRMLNAPPLAEILRDVIAFVSNQTEVSLPDSVEEQITRLMFYLQRHRCLLVLDNFEAVLQSGANHAGAYRNGYEGYGELLRRLGTTTHQSCLLLNSREKPVDVAALEGKNRPVRTLEIGGLDEASGRKILEDIGQFSGSRRDWTQLISFYSGNPLALELAAKHIAEVYFGDISKFMKLGKPVFNGLQELLDWHLERLSDLETEVIFWLAIDREPVTLSELESNILDIHASRQVPSTLQSLQRRVPLERTSSRFSLQPVLIEHVTNRVIELATNDLIAGTTTILNTHALLKALARDFVREAQARLIIAPIVDDLSISLGGHAEIEKKLRENVRKLKSAKKNDIPGYAAGNIINLLCHLTRTVDSFDFSNLDVRQAYLQEVNLHNVNLAHANISDSSFMQTFGPISCLALSPNGELVAASESNGDIHIWRLADFQVVATLRGHINWIFALAFSPDGRILASGGEDKAVRLWNLETNQCTAEFQEHSNSVWAVAFSPNGRLLATGSEDQTIKVWNLNSGKCITSMADHGQKVFALEFSPDGQKLASASADHTVKIWDIFDWHNPATLLGHTDTVRGVSFSPDSQMVASCSWDQTIRLWNAESGDCLSTLRGHTDSIHSVVYHPDGQTLASSGESGAIRIWSVRDGTCLTTLKRHIGEVWKVAFSRDGQTLASGGYDGTLRIWDTPDWVCRSTLHGYIDWVQAVAMSPDGGTVVGSNGDLTIKVWDVQSGECKVTLRGHTGWTFSATFSPDGGILATGSDDRTIRLWNSRTWKVTATLSGHSTWVQAVAFNSSGEILASGSDDRTIKLWRMSTGECVETLSGHMEGIWSLAFSPDDRYLASASEDHTIKIWDMDEGTCVMTLMGHTDRVHAVAFDPHGNRLVSCSDDKSVRVWDFSSGACLQELVGHESWVLAAVFDTTGRYIWSGGKDRSLRLWDTSSGRCDSKLIGHKGGIWSIAYGEDRGILATGSEDGSIRLWDTQLRKQLKVLRPLKPYENTNIFGVSGLTNAQRTSLRALGAVEEHGFATGKRTHDYARYAPEYASLGFDGTYYLGFRDISALLQKYANGKRALDYGCGPGRSTRFLKGLGLDAVGVDISMDMLSQAKQLDEETEYHHIRSGKIPFDDASFDVVFSSFVFIEVSTLDEISTILSEMKRVLKPDGCIVLVTVPADGFSGSWVSFSYDFPENDRVLKSGDTVKLQILGTGVVLYDYYWTNDNYDEVFSEAGLSVRELHRPLGRDADPIEWLDEKDKPFIAVYVVGHAGPSGIVAT